MKAKRILAFLLSFAMLFSTVTPTFADDGDYDGESGAVVETTTTEPTGVPETTENTSGSDSDGDQNVMETNAAAGESAGNVESSNENPTGDATPPAGNPADRARPSYPARRTADSRASEAGGSRRLSEDCAGN